MIIPVASAAGQKYKNIEYFTRIRFSFKAGKIFEALIIYK